MNKFSLVSMALSVLFCGFANANDQSVPSVPQNDAKSDATAPVDASAPVATDNAQIANEAMQVPTKPAGVKAKVNKKKCRKAKASSNRIKRTNEFTEKLNSGEEVKTEVAQPQQQATTQPTPSADSTAKA